MREVFSGSTAHRLFGCFFAVTSLLLAAHGADAQAPRSKMNCSPVTPNMKVPFIEVDQLPNVARDPAYFEWCTDLDNAWTPQSYPDPKYSPQRTPEHQARVNLLLQGLKDYAAADSDDWVSYVNAWLGSNVQPSNVEQRKFPDGETISSIAYAKGNALTKFKTTSETFSVNSRQYVSPQGEMIYRKHDMTISGLDITKLCITSVDLQKAFESQPGYLLRPMSVRTSEARPSREELARLGGQWYGYEVHVFSDAVTGYNAGLMLIGFSLPPLRRLPW